MRDFQGFWRNTDSADILIQFLQIEAVGAQLQVRAWLRCHQRADRVGPIGQCQRSGPQVLDARSLDRVLWVADEPRLGRSILNLSGDRLETLHVSSEGVGGQRRFIKVVVEARSCRRIGNGRGPGGVTCEGEGGRELAKAGSGFLPGDDVWLLVRFRNLPIGQHRLRVALSGRTARPTSPGQVIAFTNAQEDWTMWTALQEKRAGRWTAHLELDDEIRLLPVHYCVGRDCFSE
jgi:hypothetical protein